MLRGTCTSAWRGGGGGGGLGVLTDVGFGRQTFGRKR